MSDQTIILTDEHGNVHPEAAALVTTIRSAVNGVGKYAAYVATFSVTREDVKDHALALATLAYPYLPTVQKKDGKRTKFGNAVQAAGNGLRAALDKDKDEDSDTNKPVVLRVSLSGEGGATVIVPPEHEMYAAIVTMVTGIDPSVEDAA